VFERLDSPAHCSAAAQLLPSSVRPGLLLQEWMRGQTDVAKIRATSEGEVAKITATADGGSRPTARRGRVDTSARWAGPSSTDVLLVQQVAARTAVAAGLELVGHSDLLRVKRTFGW